MSDLLNPVREGEMIGTPPAETDAAVWFIGTISTPWKTSSECPRRGDLEGPECVIEVFEPWRSALDSIGRHSHLQVLYWMHRARRDLLTQSPKNDGRTSGTFSLRSPNRPNPIAASLVALVRVEGSRLVVRGLDCIDGTPLIDLKPEHCPHAGPSVAPAQG